MLAELALFALLASSAPGAELDRYVIAVGANEGGPDRPTLRFADDDAARFFLQTHKSAARAWLLTDFDAESARLYPTLTELTMPASARELARALGEAMWLIRQSKARGRATELVFYFAGHGDVSTGGEGFLVLSDGALTRTDLSRQLVEASPADTNHIILDACASFHMVARGDDESPLVTLSPAHLALVKGETTNAVAAWRKTGVLVSTSDDASVHESASVGGGVFSYLLRSAFAGGADVNGDGRIEYVETAAFIAAATAYLEDPRARVDVHARAPEARPHVALVDLKRSAADSYLVLDGAPSHIRLIDSRGLPFAEVHVDRAPIVIALAAEPFFVVKRGDDEAVLVPRRAGAYALSSLEFRPGQTARGAPDAVLERLFERPYGTAFVDGFVSESALLPPLAGAPFVVAWAPDGAPPFRVPYGLLAGIAFGTSAAFAAGSVACTVGNAVSLAALEARYQATGTIDSRLALTTDMWLAVAASTGAMAILSTVIGSGAFMLMMMEERE